MPESALGEVIAVDDASDDGTGAEIKALLGKYPALRYLRHGQRAGQSTALRTGVWAARYPGHRHHGWRRAERSGRHHDPGQAAWRGRPRACHGRRHQGGPQGARLAQSGLALCQLAARQSARRWLPGHWLRHQAVSPPSLCSASLFYDHAPLFAGALSHLRPRNCLRGGQRSAEAQGRVKIHQSWTRPDWAIRSRWGKLAAQAHAASADRRRGRAVPAAPSAEAQRSR